jgi:transcriptional regulator with XRE-family HTH domain
MTDEVSAPTKRKGGRPKGAKRAPKKLTQGELATVVLDFARGVEQNEIAKKMGLSESGVSQIIEKFKPAFAEIENVEEYRKAKASLIDSVSLATLKGLNPAKMEAAPLRDLGYLYDIMNKHSRLERGQSTSNVSTQATVKMSISSDYSEQ